MRMIEYGGGAGVELHRKTVLLYNAYKLIERAKKEVLYVKPRHEYLLPMDGRKLKADLKDDPS